MGVTTSDRNSVCVGVDGTEGGLAAVRYAAGEARRAGVSLHLVHAIPMTPPITPMFPLLPADLDPVGREILQEAEQVAVQLLSPAEVTSSLHHGSPSASLVRVAEHALLMVLGRQQRTRFERLLTGSTVASVAAQVGSPVIVVPPAWVSPTQRFHVVAGVHGDDHGADLARRAVEVAADHQGRVTLVQAWSLPSQYDALVADQLDRESWTRSAATAVEERLAGLLAAWPEVPVEVRVVHGQAARVLQRESRDADLLVLSRREHAFPSGHLGGTVRALLRESLCAVEVVPHPLEHHDAGGRVRHQGRAGDPAGAGLR